MLRPAGRCSVAVSVLQVDLRSGSVRTSWRHSITVTETTHPEPGATIMTTLARTQTTGVNAKRVTIGSVCKVAAVAAIISMISVFSADRLSSAHFAAADLTHQTELRDLLCRIDRRCTHQTETRDPARPHPFAHKAASVQAAEIVVR